LLYMRFIFIYEAVFFPLNISMEDRLLFLSSSVDIFIFCVYIVGKISFN